MDPGLFFKNPKQPKDGEWGRDDSRYSMSRTPESLPPSMEQKDKGNPFSLNNSVKSKESKKQPPLESRRFPLPKSPQIAKLEPIGRKPPPSTESFPIPKTSHPVLKKFKSAPANPSPGLIGESSSFSDNTVHLGRRSLPTFSPQDNFIQRSQDPPLFHLNKESQVQSNPPIYELNQDAKELRKSEFLIQNTKRLSPSLVSSLPPSLPIHELNQDAAEYEYTSRFSRASIIGQPVRKPAPIGKAVSPILQPLDVPQESAIPKDEPSPGPLDPTNFLPGLNSIWGRQTYSNLKKDKW